MCSCTANDLVASGTEEDMKQAKYVFCKKCITTIRGYVGPDEGDKKATVALNRSLQWGDNGMTLGADQRHGVDPEADEDG